MINSIYFAAINKTLEKPSSPMLAPQRAVAKTRFGHPVSPIGSPNRSTSRSINEFPMPQRASSKARLENPPSSPIRSPSKTNSFRLFFKKNIIFLFFCRKCANSCQFFNKPRKDGFKPKFVKSHP